LEEREIKKVLGSLKVHGLTITSALFACICSAITQLYHDGNAVEGAHLLFSAHAKRWFPTDGEDGKPPVTMAIVPGGAWISATEQQLKAKDQISLIELAKKIAEAQEADIASPHILGTFDKLAVDAINAPPPAVKAEVCVLFYYFVSFFFFLNSGIPY